MITPFRDVAARLRRLKLLDSKKIGTVHTFQGKESDAVILVLGGATPGARMWASGEPNILNVAITRAKTRLFVVGNLYNWQSAGHFASLAEALPRS